VRGLGCPVRFALTAGQSGDAPQAKALAEGLSTDAFMADTACDSGALRSVIAGMGAAPSSRTIRRERPNTRSTKRFTPGDI